MERALKIGGLAVWVHAPPAGSMPKGTPLAARVVMVHGLGEHSGRHVETAERLVARGAEVVRFDLRGNGQSAGKPQWIDRWDDYLDDVDSVRKWAEQNLAPKPELLYGHSLGGAIAIHTAARWPGSMRGLALSAPAYLPGGGISPAKIAVGRLLAKWTPKLKIGAALDVSAISRDESVVKAYQADPLCCSFNTVRQGNEILNALEVVPDRCARIQVPTLVMHGGADRLVQAVGSRKILESLASKDKKLEEFPGGYHELYHDLDKEKFYTLLTDWAVRVAR